MTKGAHGRGASAIELIARMIRVPESEKEGVNHRLACVNPPPQSMDCW